MLVGANELTDGKATSRISSVLKSLRVMPKIYHSATSKIAEKIALRLKIDMKNLEKEIQENQFSYDSNPLLLILDRREDRLSPLRIPWTYQVPIYP